MILLSVYMLKVTGLTRLMSDLVCFASFITVAPLPRFSGWKHKSLIQIVTAGSVWSIAWLWLYLSMAVYIGDYDFKNYAFWRLLYKTDILYLNSDIVIWKDVTKLTSVSVVIKLLIFQVLFYLSCKFLFCLLKRSIKVKAFPLWVTLTEVGCYTWYQSWRLPD